MAKQIHFLVTCAKTEVFTPKTKQQPIFILKTNKDLCLHPRQKRSVQSQLFTYLPACPCLHHRSPQSSLSPQQSCVSDWPAWRRWQPQWCLLGRGVPTMLGVHLQWSHDETRGRHRHQQHRWQQRHSEEPGTALQLKNTCNCVKVINHSAGCVPVTNILF